MGGWRVDVSECVRACNGGEAVRGEECRSSFPCCGCCFQLTRGVCCLLGQGSGLGHTAPEFVFGCMCACAATRRCGRHLMPLCRSRHACLPACLQERAAKSAQAASDAARAAQHAPQQPQRLDHWLAPGIVVKVTPSAVPASIEGMAPSAAPAAAASHTHGLRYALLPYGRHRTA